MEGSGCDLIWGIILACAWRKTMKILGQDSWSPGRELNQGLPDVKEE
jgi:hypothetical protein